MANSLERAMALRSLKQAEKSYKLMVNGLSRKVTATADTPLLYVLRDQLHLRGPRFGCGLAQCGSCTVHLDGQPIRSCVTPVAAVTGRKLVTLEGLAAAYFNENPKAAAAAKDGPKLHPVQQAWIDAEVPQCGYCQNGWIMYTASILGDRPHISDADMKTALSGLKCRCGTHVQILEAIGNARKAMA
jgi:aerobic-type carbon monoxide dehydrogenase small subunit (CoxS/CutS family)